MHGEIPDVYFDSTLIQVSANDVIIQLLKRSPSANTTEVPETVAFLRVSLEQAKLFTILMKSSLKNYESQLGAEIKIHPGILAQLGVSSKEDW